MNTKKTPESTVLPPGHDEESYSKAIAQIKGLSPSNPLHEKTTESIQLAISVCAEDLHRITSFFFSEVDSDFKDENTNYAPELRKLIDRVYLFLSGFTNLQDIITTLSSFDNLGNFSSTEFMDFARKIQESGTREKLIATISDLFGLTYNENVSGEVRKVLPLCILDESFSKKYYCSHRDEQNMIRPVNGRFLGKRITAVKVVKDATTAVIITLRQKTEVKPNIQEIITETPHPDKQEGTPSKAQEGQARRRARNLEIKAEKEAQRAEKEAQLIDQKNQEWYNGELEKPRALSSFLDERFEELRSFLLENIPYVNEVLDYIFTVTQLREEGYNGNSLNIKEVQGEFEKLIQDYSRAIGSQEAKNKRLKQSIATLVDRLVNKDGPEQSKLNKKIGRTQGKIERNNTYITTYSRAIASLQDEASDLFAHLTKFRLEQIPGKEQFSLAFYHSLRAGELYSSPDYFDETPITEEWIRENILKMFIKILGTHLDEFHGVNIRGLSELQKQINELPEEYSDDTRLPDIEGVSQKKVSDFFEMLYSIIPRDYLNEIPTLPTIVTPESIPEIKIVEIKERKPRKSQSELRKESHTKKIEKEEARTKLIEELHRKEEELMEYVQYWREKLVSNIRTRRAYFADIESLKHSIPGRRKYPTKGIDELEILILENKKDEEMIREKIENGGLKNDEISYKSLVEDRAQIGRRLSHLKR